MNILVKQYLLRVLNKQHKLSEIYYGPESS